MNPTPEPRDGDASPAQRPGLVRQTVEFLVVLCLGILVFRTFASEAYIVPTGSMAPTLLGMHEERDCRGCGFRYSVGLDDEGRSGRPICPNCGEHSPDDAPAVECNGDRLLVQKFLYDLRRPKRWEVAVFHFPGDPSQAYVKRIVGLPGEAIQIAGGDVFIDGRIARKSLAEQRSMRILVYDSRFPPRDSNRYPRFTFRRGPARAALASSWHSEGRRQLHDPSPADRGSSLDWMEYRHWDPDRGRYAPIHDFLGYNGGDLRGENRVKDLMVAADLEVGRDADLVELRLDSGGDRFLITLPVGGQADVAVRRNGRPLRLVNPLRRPAPAARADQTCSVEASVMDRRLTVRLDGIPLFDPYDYDDPTPGLGADEGPVAVGIRRGTLAVDRLRIYRDVYYTETLANLPRRPFAVDRPYPLGRDDYFVLGDNSAVSNDSRFWTQSPVVPGELLLGKPFLVHLPGQTFPLRVFGRSVYWVPDPREIRYIR